MNKNHAESLRLFDVSVVKLFQLLFLLGVLLLSTYSTVVPSTAPDYSTSKQFADGRFRNPVPRPELDFWRHMKLYWEFFFDKPANTVPDVTLPVVALSRAALLAAPDNSVYRLGHSALLFKMHNKFWLTDPVLSERASPIQWFGPARFHAPPISVEELPPIEAVILSHNHYDHLDQVIIQQLAKKTQYFLTPLGVGDQLIDWDIDASKVRQLDWWESTDLDGIHFIATPAQHFSGRGLWDSNKTLWSSWVMQADNFRLFFSGDSGYFAGFKEIGAKYGPFDMAFLETGAYDHKWAYVHMQPGETLQAFQDLAAKWLFPIHNGTFDLAMHAWFDPFEQITRLASSDQVRLSTPFMGERVDFLSPHAGHHWWRQ